MRVRPTLRQPRCGGSGERSSRRWSERGLGEVWGYSRKSCGEIAIRMLGGASVTGIACVRWSGAGKHFALEHAIWGEHTYETLVSSSKSTVFGAPMCLGRTITTAYLLLKI